MPVHRRRLRTAETLPSLLQCRPCGHFEHPVTGVEAGCSRGADGDNGACSVVEYRWVGDEGKSGRILDDVVCRVDGQALGLSKI